MKIFNLFLMACILMIMSCQPQRDLVYFSDISSNAPANTTIINNGETKIQQNDLLNISVNSLNAESNALFNGIHKPENKEGYRVDKTGNIQFPMVGLIKLEGLTINQAEKKIATDLNKFIKNPIVNVQFLNFRVTVIGEVNNPSTFTVQNEEINLLEALGMAGDMTAFGKRENVLVIRENQGQRSMVRMNLNKRDIMNSPYFYLKQNDVVYVEPDKAKAASVSQNSRLFPIVTTSISVAALVIQALVR